MKKKQFYDHLLEKDTIHVELEKLDITTDEKNHLLSYINSHLHIVVLDIVMSHLTTVDKEQFLKHIEEENHTNTLSFLKDKVSDIEKKITTALQFHVNDFLKDIEEVKKKKS